MELRLKLFTILVVFFISCSSSKINEKRLEYKLKNSETLREKVNKIQDFNTCKNYIAQFENPFNDEVLYQTLLEEEYDSTFKAECLVAHNFPEGIISLIQNITDTTEVGLKDYLGIIVMDRVENGDMDVLDYGDVTNDDLFRISGRCNYLLKDLTGQDFGFARMNSSKNELIELQEKWIDWVLSL